mmetsp:Transcript_62732/g.173885  ORF Transcript_62732/g.173885 Transcript_62732/m.173885 type:complete len:86 (-) Transcript_62732:79-336(-)
MRQPARPSAPSSFLRSCGWRRECKPGVGRDPRKPRHPFIPIGQVEDGVWTGGDRGDDSALEPMDWGSCFFGVINVLAIGVAEPFL